MRDIILRGCGSTIETHPVSPVTFEAAAAGSEKVKGKVQKIRYFLIFLCKDEPLRARGWLGGVWRGSLLLSRDGCLRGALQAKRRRCAAESAWFHPTRSTSAASISAVLLMHCWDRVDAWMLSRSLRTPGMSHADPRRPLVTGRVRRVTLAVGASSLLRWGVVGFVIKNGGVCYQSVLRVFGCIWRVFGKYMYCGCIRVYLNVFSLTR